MQKTTNDEIDLTLSRYNIYKNAPTDQVYWVEDLESIGPMMVTFDRKRVFNLYCDYPHEFTPEQKELFDKENPFWAKHLRGR